MALLSIQILRYKKAAGNGSERLCDMVWGCLIQFSILFYMSSQLLNCCGIAAVFRAERITATMRTYVVVVVTIVMS